MFLRDLFSSKAATAGNVIRRKARDIERFAGMGRFMEEVHRRGYQVAENSGQLVIFCNRAPIRWLTEAPVPLSLQESGAKSLKDFGAR
ncbi:MAG: aspartate aminotransferase [Pseudomonadota bacterium]